MSDQYTRERRRKKLIIRNKHAEELKKNKGLSMRVDVVKRKKILENLTLKELEKDYEDE